VKFSLLIAHSPDSQSSRKLHRRPTADFVFGRKFGVISLVLRLVTLATSKAMNAKFLSMDELAARSEELRAAGKRIVATNGCFDLLHVGHVRYLQAARALGDLLVVGLNGDRSVRELKGDGRPITAESDRAEILAALECVDLVTIFPQLRATEFIAAVRPAIYVKGGDYSSETLDEEERAVLKNVGAEIHIIPFETGYSTSRLIEQICKSGT
jgi:rfaE bifunctional protein nucleotidyltransferase chain/domain